MRYVSGPLTRCALMHACACMRSLQVAAVCIYVYCRLEARPYMLIDFADHISVNIYQLGGCAWVYTCMYVPHACMRAARTAASATACSAVRIIVPPQPPCSSSSAVAWRARDARGQKEVKGQCVNALAWPGAWRPCCCQRCTCQMMSVNKDHAACEHLLPALPCPA